MQILGNSLGGSVLTYSDMMQERNELHSAYNRRLIASWETFIMSIIHTILYLFLWCTPVC